MSEECDKRLKSYKSDISHSFIYYLSIYSEVTVTELYNFQMNKNRYKMKC
jgi:hypothetical protein